MKKILIIVLVVAAAVIVFYLYWSRGLQKQVPAPAFDFGDAPQTFAVAKTKELNKVWLGDGVSPEQVQKSVDADDLDDGIELDAQGQKGTAYFTLHKSDGQKGTAYLNLFIDWNNNGKWEADEWAVKNFPVDVSAQESETQLYAVDFNALSALPSREKMFWYRATVTLDGKMESDNGGGSFAAGEIEDYGPTNEFGKEPSYKLFCDPTVLKLKHGESGAIGVSGFGFLSLANSVQPKNQDREISVVPTASGTSFIHFKSTHVHKRDPVVELESVPVRVDIYGATPGVKIASRIKNCPVAVTHDPLEPMRPADNPKTTDTGTGLVKTPSFDSNYTKKISDNRMVLSVNITPQDLVGQNITKIEIPLQARNYTLPNPESVDVSLNSSGSSGGWTCLAGATISCSGTAGLEAGKTTTINMIANISSGNLPSYISGSLYNSSGKKVMGLGIQLK